MVPPELSLRSPLPSPLAMNNSPPEGPMRFAKRVFLVNARCAEANDRTPSSRKNAVTLIPNLIMEKLAPYRASYASLPHRHNDFMESASYEPSNCRRSRTGIDIVRPVPKRTKQTLALLCPLSEQCDKKRFGR